MIELARGNLLVADVEALVNTVNTVGVMGKGIALQFKKAFPANFEAYARACERGEVAPGKIFVFDMGTLGGPRYILNFPTKRHYRDRARLDDIAAGLNDLVDVVVQRGIRSIAIPPLGCGNGGLAWKTVYPLIEEAMSASDLEGVRVIVYEPAGEPDPDQMVDRTTRPKMTAGRAALLLLMHRYLATGWEYRLSLLELQKLAYFLQESGQDLKLRFRPLFYGPYADELRHVLNRIEGHFVHGFGAGQNKPQTPIEPSGDAIGEAEAFLARDSAVMHRLDAVSALIENFETPFGMELLSSVHWVGRHGVAGSPAKDPRGALEQLKHWNNRKSRTFQAKHVDQAWDRLATTDWTGIPAEPREQRSSKS
jgi:O-acetyl-ADP-ribose deacetylase (regulator of RNase III)